MQLCLYCSSSCSSKDDQKFLKNPSKISHHMIERFWQMRFVVRGPSRKSITKSDCPSLHERKGSWQESRETVWASRKSHQSTQMGDDWRSLMTDWLTWIHRFIANAKGFKSKWVHTNLSKIWIFLVVSGFSLRFWWSTWCVRLFITCVTVTGNTCTFTFKT